MFIAALFMRERERERGPEREREIQRDECNGTSLVNKSQIKIDFRLSKTNTFLYTYLISQQHLQVV